ncbi:MAG: hypothetical protein ACI93R_004249 [Flavobacteriales bacterium]|jgi:hypothetical protein
MRLVFVSFLSVIFITACGGSATSSNGAREVLVDDIEPSNFTDLDDLGGRVVLNQSFTSQLTGVAYPYHFYLPSSYDNNTDQDYQVLYGLDAQWTFPGFVQEIDKKNRQMIFIGIEEGPLGSNRRLIDYIIPGVELYFSFFIQEFMPYIESTYRISDLERSFQGTSAGGNTATAAIFLDDAINPIFKSYIIYDAALWHEPGLMNELIQRRFNINTVFDADIYVTTATNFGNHDAVESFFDEFKLREYTGIDFLELSYPVTHDEIAPASFPTSLSAIYGATGPDSGTQR